MLASISYAANFLASTDIEVVAATNTSPVEITTDGEHGFATGDPVMVRDVEGNTGANGTWTVTVRSETTLVLDGSEGSGRYTGGGTVAAGDLLYRWSTVIGGARAVRDHPGARALHRARPSAGAFSGCARRSPGAPRRAGSQRRSS